MNHRNDRVIKVGEVWRYVKRRWLSVLLCGIVCAVLLAGLCYLKNRGASDAGQTAPPDADNLENVYEDFTETEKAAVEYAIYTHDRLEEQEQYISESLYMKLTPYHLSQSAYQILVELTAEPDTDDARAAEENKIIAAYGSYISSGGLASDLADGDLLPESYTVSQIKDLFWISYDSGLEGNGSFTLYIVGTDLVDGLDEAAYETLTAHASDLDGVSKHKLTLIDKSESVTRSDSIYNSQRTIYNERLGSIDRLENAIAELSGNTLAYYQDMIAEETEAESETASSANAAKGTQTDETEQAPAVSKRKLLKYGIVGGVLGCAGMCVLWLLIYMYSSKIVAVTDYTLTMGLRMLGRISESETDKAIGFAAAKILAVCKKQEIAKVAVVSSDDSLLGEDICTGLTSMLEKQGVEPVFLKDVTGDPSVMGQLFETGAAAFVEKTGYSVYDRVYDMTELCIDGGVELIGVIDIQK